MTTLHTQSPPALHAPVSPRLHFVHVPTPGDHYSPATGSAVITVIHELAKAHAAQHLPTSIIVAKGTTEGYPPYSTGTLLQADLPLALPSKPKRMLEAALARAFLARPFTANLYANLPSVLPRSFDGTLFLHNSPAAIPLLRKELPHAQIVLYAHNQLFNTYSPRETRRILDHAHAIICVSQFIANDLVARAGTTSPKIGTVLNGIDTDAFHPPPKPPPADPPVILFLGRTLPEKGPDLLLKAAATIASPQRLFKIRIVGSANFNPHSPLSPYEQHLRSLADHSSLKGRVEFVPTLPRGQILAEFHRAHVFVAPSNWDDPCPLTVLEGLACGLPMIVSNRGGIPEQVADAALTFAPPDVTALAHHLATLLDAPAVREQWACRARLRACALSWNHQYARLFRFAAGNEP